MKLLNPFAGYRAASGHLLYHVVFFLASYSINIFGNEIEYVENFVADEASPEEVEAHDYLETAIFAAKLLRYCHVVVVVLQIFCFWLDNYEPKVIDKEQKEKAKEAKLGLSLTGTQIVSQNDQSVSPLTQPEKNQITPSTVDMKGQERKSSRNAIVHIDDTVPNSNNSTRAKGEGADG